MKRFISGAVLFLGGVWLGWWLHGNQSASFPPDRAAIPRDSNRPVLNSSATEGGESRVSTDSPFTLVVKTDGQTGVQRFQQLLSRQDFDEALIFYEEAQALGEGYAPLLKPELVAYLRNCLEQRSDGAFVALVDAWLAAYYDDIPVLLLLAEYQWRQGYPEEAARVMQIAMTYAYETAQREDVSRAVQRLVKSTDADYSQDRRWIELLAFYEVLQAIGLEEKAFALRRARIHRLLGESQTALSILQELQETDDGLDPKWTSSLELELAETAPEPELEPVPPSAVPLTARGDHYLIETVLNDRQQVLLMIDTGASVTSLSRSSFDRLDDTGYLHLGPRLFNTANGITRGEVYRVDSLVIGGARLNDIELAVLDYDSMPGVDGLLGMNVLRNYRFEIDQDADLLYLRSR